MDKLKKFFWLCSGANHDILDKNETEASKYAGIGATIFFTGIFASLAAFYAMYTVFDNVWMAGVTGLVWGLMIFNLDRFIVSSMRKSSSGWKEFALATPRIILAIMIAVVISKPLEMRVFEKEINAELSLMEQEFEIEKSQLIEDRFIPGIDSLQSEIDALKSEVALKAEKRDELRMIAQQEADGTGGTMRRNAGPIYRIKKADADRVEQELIALNARNNELIAQKITQQEELRNKMNQAIANEEEVALSGLASRIEALDRLTMSSSAVWAANLFIILLFILIETAPVIVKLLSPRGPYDYSLESIEYDVKAENLQSLAKSNARIKRRSSRLPSTEREFVDERLDMGLQQI